MRLILSLAALSVSLVGGVAAAEPHREVVHERAVEHGNRTVVHEDVHVRGPVVRENVRENVHVGGPVVHENIHVGGPGVRENVVVHENVRENVVLREPGREGVVVRGGPVWHEGVHFTDYHVRPEYRYENWAPIHGYNWHRGDWVFNGVEWVWTPGWYVRVDL